MNHATRHTTAPWESYTGPIVPRLPKGHGGLRRKAGVPRQGLRHPKMTMKSARFPQKDPTKDVEVTGGQKGPLLDLPIELMNPKERAVLASFRGTIPLSIVEIAKIAFTNSAKGNLTVRNSLRRLVRGTWVERVDRGEFRLTPYALLMLKLAS